MQLSESRGTLQETGRPSRPQTPPRRMDKEARPNSRPKSAPKERRPELSVHAKRQAEDAPQRGPVLLHGLPGQRMEKRAAERAERERRKGQMLKEELARSPRPEREELARLSSQRSRSTLDREEKTSPGRMAKAAPTGPKSAARPANGKEAMPADLFEIPEQLREARRRTTELEAQLAELRKRLQLQENRSAAMLTPAGLTVVAPAGPGTPLAPGMAPGGAAFPTPRVADPVYVNAAGATTVSTMDGGRTPSRYSFPVDGAGPGPSPGPPAVHPTSRSLSPPRWSQAPTMGWTWPEKGAIYAAPTVRAPALRVASTSPTRVVHMSPSPPRVASPIRFIAQTPPGPPGPPMAMGPMGPVGAMGPMGAMARPMATLPTATTFGSHEPCPFHRSQYDKRPGERASQTWPKSPRIRKPVQGWAALSEPTSSL